jgi:hypothetical protein
MNKNYVRIAGGLGNQLFQISFGRTLPGTTTYFHFGDFETETAKRIIESFGGKLLSLEKSHAFNKIANLSLRFGSRHLSNIFIKRILEYLVVRLARKVLRIKIHFNLRNSLGFVGEHLTTSDNPQLYIGYFQSYMFAGKLQGINKTLLTEKELDYFNKYTEIAILEKPIALQVRLGDYLGENTFGIPSVSYFRAGLQEIDKSNERNIWVFTNDNDKVLEYLPKEIASRCRIIDEPSASPLLMLFIMSLANEFVISNSTFGWWAAYLKANPKRKVVVPEPWFAKANVPTNLIPPNWIKIESGFKDE